MSLRTCLDADGTVAELLEPVNLRLSLSRNLSASWYQELVAMEIDAALKPMKV